MARPRVLTGAKEEQLEALLDLGLTQAAAARALQVSTRSVQRWVAAGYATTPRETLDEWLARLGRDDFDPLAEAAAAASPQTRARRRRSEPGWEQAARFLEREHSDRWGLPAEGDASG